MPNPTGIAEEDFCLRSKRDSRLASGSSILFFISFFSLFSKNIYGTNSCKAMRTDLFSWSMQMIMSFRPREKPEKKEEAVDTSHVRMLRGG